MKLLHYLFTIGDKSYIGASVLLDNEYSAGSDGFRKTFVERKEALVGHSFTKEKK